MQQRIIDAQNVKRFAGLELNALMAAGILPTEVFMNAKVEKPTPIYDINGNVLFFRVSIKKRSTSIGYADIAACKAFSEPLIGVSYGCEWNEKAIVEEATFAARRQKKGVTFSEVRIVAYSYPKLAVQFTLQGIEILMLELRTWKPVPKQPDEKERSDPYFQRWSLLDLPDEKQKRNWQSLTQRLGEWDDICPPLPGIPAKTPVIRPEVLNPRVFDDFKPVVKTHSREIHYSTDNADHTPCYELRGQLTGVWCVAASVQMLLDFYRYNYQQTRIASDLGLGTLTAPNGLPYSRDNDVVTVLQSLTSNALTASMDTSPSWNEFVTQIDQNHPVISFIPGHSRTVAGYTSTKIFTWYSFRGLLVYDPWPPTTGVITRWENFANQSYRVTFTANLTLV